MITLYAAPTSNGQKAAIALEEAGLAYEVRTVNLMVGEHMAAEFLAINPAGRIPALVDGDIVINGTIPIAQYVADKTASLTPKSRAEELAMREAVAVIGTDLAPAFTGLFLNKFINEEPSAGMTAIFDGSARRMLTVLDGWLATRSFLAGDTITIADVLAYPHVATSTKTNGMDVGDWPNLARWAAMMGDRPAVQKGMAVCR